MVETVIAVVLIALASLMALPAMLFFLECVLGATWRERQPKATRPPGARAVVLIPAHNEEDGLAATLTALRAELSSQDSIFVVADNCSDRTADVARELGVEVAIRQHATERGKGYALVFGAERIAAAQTPPDVVVVLDADCRFRKGEFENLVAECLVRGRPVQADDELLCSGNASTRTKIGIFAFRVKNTLRARGMIRLGIPRHLTGTGMAFPFATFRNAPNTRGWIAEDLVLGLELALRGHSVALCSRAMVESDVAPTDSGRSGQRQRWEHGHLSALSQYVPKLIWAGIKQGKPSLLGLAMDLAVPPLALLSLLLFSAMSLAAIAAILGAGIVPFAVLASASLALCIAVVIAWWRLGRDLLSAGDLMRIPLYVAGKMASYVSWFAGRKVRTWMRAERGRSKQS